MAESQEALVSLLTLRAGEEMEQVLPPAEECPQVSLAEVARQDVTGDHCLLTRLVSVDTDHITRSEHLVAENRIRLILQDLSSESKCYCWLFGDYSDAFVRLRLKPSDLVMFRNPRVVRTKLKYKQVLPADMSDWTIHCLSRERKLVTFVRVEEGQGENEEMEKETEDEEGELEEAAGVVKPLDEEDPSESAINALIEAMNNSNSLIAIEEALSPPVVTESATQNIENISPNIPTRNNKPAKTVVVQSSGQSLRPNYVFLAQCQTHKQKYNVWAIITEVLEIPRRRKSKIVAKVLLTDESLSVTGDLREKFKFDILADSFEQMPRLEVGSVVRIHHMTVEVFNGKSDGRVYSGHCVTVVAGGPGDIINPECTGRRAGKVLVWDEEDKNRVRQLREVWAGSSVQERTLEDIKDVCVSSLSCRIVEVIRLAGDLVLRLEDGTVTTLNTLEFRGAETETRDQPGDKKTWIDVWVEFQEARRDVERLMLDAGDYVMIERLNCLLIEDEDRVGSFRFSVQSGSIQKLQINSEAVKSLMIRLNDVPGESQEDSYLANILDAINRDGSFIAPFSQDERVFTSTQDERSAPSLFLPPASLPSPGAKDLTRPVDTQSARDQSEELSGASLPLAQYQLSPRSQSPSSLASPETFSSVEISGLTQQLSSQDTGVTPEVSRKEVLMKSNSSSPPQPVREPPLRSSLSPLNMVMALFSPRPTRTKYRARSSESSSLPGASSNSASEMSANLLEGDDPTRPAKSPTVEESSEVWSQMTQFLAEDVPVRTKPSESMMSSQSSSGSYESCRETLSDQMDEEEGNVPVDSMELEEDIEENDTHAKTDTKNSNIEKSDETAMEQDANETEDIFEASDDSVEAEGMPEEGNTVSSYRSNLVVACQPSSSEFPRRDCASLKSEPPGKYRLLCLINDVEKERVVVGYCKECGKQEDQDKFEQKEGHLFCCSKDGKRVRAKLKFCIAVNVFDHSTALSPASKMVISDQVAEKFLGVTVRDFVESEEVRGDTIRKLMALERKLAEFCVEKIHESEVLYVFNSVIRF